MKILDRNVILTSAVTAVLTVAASADTFQWNAATGGNWTDSAKWTRLAGTGVAPPGAGDTAIFSVNGSSSDAYHVGLTSNVTIDALTATARYANLGSAMGQPRRTLNVTSGAADFTVNGSDAYFWVGAEDNDPGLNVNVGDATTVSNGAFFFLGRSSFSTNRLLLGTTGGTNSDPSVIQVSSLGALGVTTTQTTSIGTAGVGWLDVYGSAIFSGTLNVGRAGVDTASGYVSVDGTLFAPTIAIGGGAADLSQGSVEVKPGGALLANGTITVGGAAGTGRGFLSLTDGQLTTGENAFVINPTGSVSLTSPVDSFVRSPINVNGGSLAIYGSAAGLNWDPDATITVRNGGTFVASGTLTLPANLTHVQAGARYYQGDDTITVPAGGTLTLDGTMQTNNSRTLVRGTVNFNSTDYSRFGSNEVTIADGGIFNANTPWGLPSTGTLTITGAGSSFRDHTSGTLAFGTSSFSGSLATVSVQPGGTLRKDAGVVEIGQRGKLELNGGTLIADDLARNASGTFSFISGSVIIDAPLPVGSWSPLPGNMNLLPGQKIQTLSTATIEPTRLLQLSGGELRAHSIVNNGLMQLDAGTLAITGGTYTGPAVTVGANAALAGTGSVNARINGAVGSTISAEGDFAVGDPANAAGFATAGDVITGAHTITLRDANAAVLGALTQVGAGASAGTLAAPNGLLLTTGASMTGFGTIDTPNDAARPLVADGAVAGDNALRPLTLGGYVKGTGHFGNVVFHGTFDPGNNGPARIVAGDLAFASGSRLKVDLGGPVAGTGFDQIDAAGFGVRLDGTLSLTRLNNYTPTMLVPHQIIGADAIDGTFDLIDGSIQSATLGLAVTYAEEAVFVTAALPGDANLDGVVALADFAILASRYNLAGTWIEGNFNGNASVELGDFALLAGNFNAGAPIQPPTPARSAAVPEPAALAMVIAAMSGILLPRRRQDRD